MEISHDRCNEGSLGAVNRNPRGVGFNGVPTVKREVVSAFLPVLYRECTFVQI